MGSVSADALKYWSVLNDHGTELLKSVEDDWMTLLADKTKKEPDYLAFLSENSAFFFSHAVQFQYFAISELRLGTDYRIDFVLPVENFSYGLTYCLVEIESPHTRPFTKKRVASARLNAAMQQIRDWRNWIKANRAPAKRIFPSSAWTMDSLPVFTYRIVIGRRDDEDRHHDKVMECAADIRAEIRSFDWLTDLLRFKIKHGEFRTSIMGGLSPQIAGMNDAVKNAIMNPFACSLTEGEWKEIVRERPRPICHFISSVGAGLANALRSNARFPQFEKLWVSLPKRIRNRISRDFDPKRG